jgi:5'-nucleotidase
VAPVLDRAGWAGLAFVLGCSGTVPFAEERRVERRSRPAAEVASEGAAASPEELTLTIVGTNDLHGRVERVAVLAGYVQILRRQRERDGGAVLLVDAGDMWQGTLESNLFEGATVTQAYAALRWDAATIGNHEFDFGPVGPSAIPRAAEDDPRGALRARAREAGFPLLSANVLDAATGRRPDWPEIQSRVVIEKAGVRVAVIGVTTEATPGTTIAANFVGLQMAPLVETIVAEAQAARDTDGATVVVVLAHAGGRCREFEHPADATSCDGSQEIMQVARALPAGTVDAIVAGHTHAAVAHVVNGIPIVESWSNGRGLGRIDLRVSRETGRVVRSDVRPPRALCVRPEASLDACAPGTYEGETVEIDRSVLEGIASELAQATEARARVLGVRAETALANAYGEEAPLGNLVADLIRESRPGVDVGLINGGGVRTDLAAGPVTYGEIYEVFPFDNRLALVRMTGTELRRMFEANLRSDGGFFFVSGLRVEATCETGTRRRLRVRITREDGRAVRDDEVLTVATSDFLTSTGSGELADRGRAGAVTVEDVPLRELLVERISTRATVRGDDPAIHDPARPRVRYPGRRPVRCREEGAAR